jgi:arsenite methyltransferase
LRLYEHLGMTPASRAGIRPGGLQLTDRSLAKCRFRPGALLLDVGCGHGISLDHIGRELGLGGVGIDPSQALLGQARQRASSLRLIRGQGEQLPFRGVCFDGVILECVLSLIEKRSTALQECHRVLKAGGRIIVSDLYARNPAGAPSLRSLSAPSCLRGCTSRDRLMADFVGAGFAIDLWEDHSYLLRKLVFELVWSCGSLEKFWSLTTGVDSVQAARSVKESRPGYFLLIGHKVEGGSGKGDHESEDT